MKGAILTVLIMAVLVGACIHPRAFTFASDSFLGEIYVDLIKPDYEAGEALEFYLKAVNGKIDTSIPFDITLQLHKPDGSVVEKQFKRINELCVRPRGEWRRDCKIVPFEKVPVWWHHSYQPVLDQAGIYRITGSSDSGAVRVRDYSFTVRSERINSLFIPDEIAGYKLRGKEKTLRFGAYGMSSDLFQALYLSDELLEPNSVEHKEIIVRIAVFNSIQSGQYGATTTLAGQTITLTQGFGFTGAWPSGVYLIEVWGHEFGDNEKQFIKAYLVKYPSSLR